MLDYKNIQFYAIKEFVFEGDTDEMAAKIVGLICTQTSENGKPEVVSSMPTKGDFESSFESYPIDKLVELPWHVIFRKEVERKKNEK